LAVDKVIAIVKSRYFLDHSVHVCVHLCDPNYNSRTITVRVCKYYADQQGKLTTNAHIRISPEVQRLTYEATTKTEGCLWWPRLSASVDFFAVALQDIKEDRHTQIS